MTVESGERPADLDASRPAGPSETPAPVEVDPDGAFVWESLCETWLAQRVVHAEETHVKGGYAWDTSSYLPVFLTDQDGDPVLAFARQ